MRQYRSSSPANKEPQPESKQHSTLIQTIRQRLAYFYAKFQPLLFLSIGIIIVLAGMFIYGLIKPAPQPLTQHDIDVAVERSLESVKPKPSYASLAYEVIQPSVVRINATIVGQGGKFESSTGTGVVVDQRGTILTCFHVVEGAVTINVIFADGFKSDAIVINQIPENDLAVLQPGIIPDDLIPATITSASTLNIGDEVFAVGNPFGINRSLSAGVVSGLKRTFRAISSGQLLTNLIQFDAAVNPGNSGGPLVNRDGEVVGIVAGLLNPNDDDVFIGIGFAIPIETAATAAGAPPY